MSTERLFTNNMSAYNFPGLIAQKQNAEILSKEEIQWFVSQVCNKSAHDAQIGAMLMAIFLKGMTREETAVLTECMTNSGEVLSWPDSWKHLVVDKHSTGGVGDKISLVLAPALAACGLKVPMISGRSLGFTGGTLDKLESIPGYNVLLSPSEMLEILENVGCCIVGQTEALVPADKSLYAIRDITSTVASQPLIVSSIISKKAAEGLSCLVLDVKFGCGSFQKTKAEAECLAAALTATSKAMGIKTTSFVTEMDQPLGSAVGNSVEVIEAIECLQGNGPADVLELVICQGGELLHLNEQVDSFEEGKRKIQDVLKNGAALLKFKQMIVAQGVDEKVGCELIENPRNALPLSKHTTVLNAPKTGTVTNIDALTCAQVSAALGAGRSFPTDNVTHNTGLLLKISKGGFIEKGQPWVELFHVEDTMNSSLKKDLEDAITIDDDSTASKASENSRVHSIIRDTSVGKPVMKCQ
ncbi:thymidine phosphorylase-like isoform X1 [Hydractinia symbiolongicarpus]|uniref:thymidine phosphorylase-like isoform X1 n=2 Tax=Hydractinia symbiolongicarpus TaxID=13093 RepID=UPI00254A4729|nr:thymidine phosphorylase-like isoform X1 [Hydractinia symbiolongicarpus]XP_057313479.1 thymidine phosphorylase-like isoform X1 [Hydractinia symbiolongicarpus]